jgi:hypothetical protein
MASNINADPIDSNFPVAGTNNSTQGFRDNFSNIKNNLNYAKFELTDLQNKAILKSALIGQTLDNDFSESVISNATLKSTGVAISDLGGVTGSAELDFSIASHYLITTVDSVTVSFSNWPTAGICGSMRLVIKITNTAHKLTIPGSVSRGLSNIARLTSNSVNGLSIKPPTTISAGSGTTWTVSPAQSQGVGSAANPVTFTGTATGGASATFRGYIVGVTLTVLSVTTGTITTGMTLAETGGIGSSTIAFDLVGDYVFDFETIDNGTAVLILDQSRASNVENVTYTPPTALPASAGNAGVVKVGAGLNVTADGTLSTKIATSSVAGVVKVGTGLTGAADGTLSVALPVATASNAGVIKVGAGLSIAADGTLSVGGGTGTGTGTSTGTGTGGALSGSSLITGILSYSITPTALGTYDPTPFLNAQPGKEWIQLGQGTWNGSSYVNIQYPSLRIPNDGPYRFRVIGFARISGQIQNSNDRMMLKIYVNGVDSGAGEITFSATANYATTPIDQFVDIAGLKRGDLIQAFFKTTSGRIPNNAFYMQAGFSILIAGNTCHGTKSLDDYAVTNNSTSLLGDRSTSIYFLGPEPVSSDGGGPGTGTF